MAGNTPNLDLYLPGGGSSGLWVPDEVADIDKINQNMQKVDTAIGDLWGMANPSTQRFRSSSGNDVSLVSTTHPFQLGPTAGSNLRADGNEIQSVVNGAADTLGLNIEGGDVNIGNDGSVVSLGGIKSSRIKPTSANPAGGTATINSANKVDISACTSVRINGAFANELAYEVLVYVWDVSGTATNLYAGLSVGGTNETALRTGWMGFGQSSWGANGGDVATTNPSICGTVTGLTGGAYRFVVFLPGSSAERTKMFYDGVHDNNNGERFAGWVHDTNIAATDGFRFGVTGGGNFTGVISIRQLH